MCVCVNIGPPPPSPKRRVFGSPSSRIKALQKPPARHPPNLPHPTPLARSTQAAPPPPRAPSATDRKISRLEREDALKRRLLVVNPRHLLPEERDALESQSAKGRSATRRVLDLGTGIFSLTEPMMFHQSDQSQPVGRFKGNTHHLLTLISARSSPKPDPSRRPTSRSSAQGSIHSGFRWPLVSWEEIKGLTAGRLWVRSAHGMRPPPLGCLDLRPSPKCSAFRAQSTAKLPSGSARCLEHGVQTVFLFLRPAQRCCLHKRSCLSHMDTQQNCKRTTCLPTKPVKGYLYLLWNSLMKWGYLSFKLKPRKLNLQRRIGAKSPYQYPH